MSDSVAPGIIRKLWPAEATVFRDHLLRLDRDSRRNRFGSAVSEDFIEHYSARVFRSGAVVHGGFIEGKLRAAAELYPFSEVLADEAEAAFSVERDFQNLGLGTRLLESCVLVARNRGIRTLHMNCLAHNRRMQKMVRKFDATLAFELDEVTAQVKTPFPTAISLAQEASADARGVAGAMLQVQWRATGRVLDMLLPHAA